MSYILRALRKSEAERTKGMVPRISTQHEVQAPRRSRVWPVVAAVAVIANGAILGLVLWQSKVLPQPMTAGAGQVSEAVAAVPEAQPLPEPEASPGIMPEATPEVTQVASLETEADAAVEANPTPTEQPVVTEPVDPDPDLGILPDSVDTIEPSVPVAFPSSTGADEARSTQDVTMAEIVPRTAVEPAEPQVEEPDEASQPPVAAAAMATEVPAILEPAASPEAPPRPRFKPREVMAKTLSRTPDRVRTVAEPRPAGSELSAPQVALAIAEPEPDPATAPRQVPVDPYAGVPELWRMPGTFRNTVPKTTIAVHVYTPEQQGRFIIVDRKKYWEGDHLESGLLVEAILPEGVVFELGGQKFKLTSS